MERKFILERQRVGIEAAEAKGGVYKGRKPSVPVEEVRRLYGEGGTGGNRRGPGRVAHERLAGTECRSRLKSPRR
jgi:DNA invertase Pin-like site-specific DNA recombinase